MRKGVDKRKDQSYFLYRLGQDALSRTLFPLGELTKEKVRRLAKRLGSPTADEEESQEACFARDGDYRSFLGSRLPARPGPIIDREGNVLGRHQGVANYTTGQRRGLGVASARPLYVLSIDVSRNEVVVGDEADAYTKWVVAREPHWIGDRPCAMSRLSARVRFQMAEAPVAVRETVDGKIEVEFERPVWAPTPGQALVFYEKDVVAGGATIARPE